VTGLCAAACAIDIDNGSGTEAPQSATTDRVRTISMEALMKAILVVMSLLLSTSAFADATCDATAKDKKLAGAALTSFMKKCEKDATAKCEADAKAKNLHGAAQTSFTKKCVKDATGA
jgi:hypothetical protein